MVKPRQPREARSSTAQTRVRQLVSPGSRPMTLTRRRVSPNVLSMKLEALASTFVTSMAGVVTFTLLSLHQQGSIAPDWPTGIALGVGGLAGGYSVPGCSPGCLTY